VILIARTSARVVGAVLLSVLLSGCGGSSKSGRRLVYNFAAVWREGVHTCTPSYPVRSLSQGVSGLVVAEVTFGPDGKVKSAQLLQSPDVLIGEATISCASAWAVGVSADRQLERTAKLYFYYVLSGGEGHVYLGNNPDDRKVLSMAVGGIEPR
jgi:hypothetical protein